jgi:hypothetical protein
MAQDYTNQGIKATTSLSKKQSKKLNNKLKIEVFVDKSKESNEDTFKLLKAVERFLLSRLGEVIQYDNWSKEIALTYLKETPSFATGEAISLANLTEEELFSLGFKTWELDTKEVIYLIPIWLKHILPTDLEVTSINGTKATLAECDNDNRQGCLAFGVK